MTRESSIDGNTQVVNLTVNELIQIIDNGKSVKVNTGFSAEGKDYIFGMAGLAKLLGCSLPTAQKIKDSGAIPYIPVGRKFVFDKEAVLTALNKEVSA